MADTLRGGPAIDRITVLENIVKNLADRGTQAPPANRTVRGNGGMSIGSPTTPPNMPPALLVLARLDQVGGELHDVIGQLTARLEGVLAMARDEPGQTKPVEPPRPTVGESNLVSSLHSTADRFEIAVTRLRTLIAHLEV